jgi:hypothetical protein
MSATLRPIYWIRAGMTPHDGMVFVWARDSAAHYHKRILLLRSAPVDAGDPLTELDRQAIPALIKHLERLGESLKSLHSSYPDEQDVANAFHVWNGYIMNLSS